VDEVDEQDGEAPDLDLDELERRGAYDPSAPDAADRLALIRYVLELGGTLHQIAAAEGALGDLALDLALRPDRRTTLGAVTSSAGLEWVDAERLLTAIGLPGDPDEAVTASEAAAAELLLTVSSQLFGEGATVQLARVTGRALARIADALVATFRVNVELPRLGQGMPRLDLVKEYSEVADTLLPAFISMLDALLRRQVVTVAGRMWSTDAEQSAMTMTRTVGFVDLVGYTAAAATMTVRELTDVLVQFDEQTADAVARGNGRIVKTIGDEAMFVTEEPAAACRIALDLVRAFDDGPLPPVRVGLATGELVSVLGDVYGLEVNLAARLVAAAEPATVLVSDRVRDSAMSDFRFAPIGELSLKGFGDPVAAYRLHDRSRSGRER
jgi:adenylate cyclase